MPRPQISGGTKQEIAGLTAEDFNVPAHRVSFEDRLRVLLEEYRELREQNQELREENQQLREMVQKRQAEEIMGQAEPGR